LPYPLEVHLALTEVEDREGISEGTLGHEAILDFGASVNKSMFSGEKFVYILA